MFSCEHGGNRLPAAYRAVFAPYQHLLDTHHAYDIGALALARLLARRLDAPLHASGTTRLLVDLNRSVGHRGLFSPATGSLSKHERHHIIDRFYHPYRARVQAQVHDAVSRKQPMLHISVHSFTAQLKGVERNADIGFLYDPQRVAEKRFCMRWQQALSSRTPGLRVRRNYPYRGTADGLTSYLRKHYSPDVYAGIELEVNQALLISGRRAAQATAELLYSSLRETLRDAGAWATALRWNML